MRNLFNTPHKAVRLLAARLPFTTALSCEAIAPFLMPFSENTLDAKTHARIAGHIAGCPNCQAEVQMLGDMADFFRANPPQTAAPAPNLWQSIEAQIQAETPDRIAAFKANPQVTSAPGRTHFDWNSFVRSFAATGGVMTAVVAGIWIFAARHPLEKPIHNPAPTVATASATETPTTIQLIPKRPASTSDTPSMQAAPLAARVPVMRARTSATTTHRAADLPLLSTQRVAKAALKRNVTVVATSGTFGPVVSQPVRPLQPLEDKSAIARSVRLSTGNSSPNDSARLPQAQTFASESTLSDSVRGNQEVTQASADMRGGDALPVVRKMLDSVLEQATVVAVAASLSAQKRQVNAPSLAALPDAEVGEERTDSAGAMTSSDAGFATHETHDARGMTKAEAPAPTTRRVARKTQVAWLVEDGARPERSAADATRPERRQQSLFSYGSR